jgi:hypothetical protein
MGRHDALLRNESEEAGKKKRKHIREGEEGGHGGDDATPPKICLALA